VAARAFNGARPGIPAALWPVLAPWAEPAPMPPLIRTWPARYEGGLRAPDKTNRLK
jgi:hypothetical protein